MMGSARRYRLAWCCCALAAAAFVCARACRAQPAAEIASLIAGAQEFDGKEVLVEGEVIGDIMVRGDFAWVTILDAGSALGIWLPAADARAIRHAGSYREVGDRIQVSGTFHWVCPEHGGDMDVHASALKMLAPGTRRGYALDKGKKKLALRLSGILVLLWIFSLLKIR